MICNLIFFEHVFFNLLCINPLGGVYQSKCASFVMDAPGAHTHKAAEIWCLCHKRYISSFFIKQILIEIWLNNMIKSNFYFNC